MSKLSFDGIRILPEMLLAGHHMMMSYEHNLTAELWKNFMMNIHSTGQLTNGTLFSVEIYDAGFFDNFSPKNKFIKWAAIQIPPGIIQYDSEITDSIKLTTDTLVSAMDILKIPSGEYALFNYKGSSADAAKLFGYIYGEWLPASGYRLDHRPHFQKLGDKYRNNDENSEEEIWIPVTKR